MAGATWGPQTLVGEVLAARDVDLLLANVLLRRKDGGALMDTQLYKLFWTATLRLAGVKTNPQLVRASVVTFLRYAVRIPQSLEIL